MMRGPMMRKKTLQRILGLIKKAIHLHAIDIRIHQIPIQTEIRTGKARPLHQPEPFLWLCILYNILCLYPKLQHHFSLSSVYSRSK